MQAMRRPDPPAELALQSAALLAWWRIHHHTGSSARQPPVAVSTSKAGCRASIPTRANHRAISRKDDHE